MIHIDWAALGMVTAVAFVASVVFIVLLAGGVRFLSAARIRTNQGQSGSSRLFTGYTLVGLAGLIVLYGIYLIVPLFH